MTEVFMFDGFDGMYRDGARVEIGIHVALDEYGVYLSEKCSVTFGYVVVSRHPDNQNEIVSVAIVCAGCGYTIGQ